MSFLYPSSGHSHFETAWNIASKLAILFSSYFNSYNYLSKKTITRIAMQVFARQQCLSTYFKKQCFFPLLFLSTPTPLRAHSTRHLPFLTLSGTPPSNEALPLHALPCPAPPRDQAVTLFKAFHKSVICWPSHYHQ